MPEPRKAQCERACKRKRTTVQQSKEPTHLPDNDHNDDQGGENNDDRDEHDHDNDQGGENDDDRDEHDHDDDHGGKNDDDRDEHDHDDNHHGENDDGENDDDDDDGCSSTVWSERDGRILLRNRMRRRRRRKRIVDATVNSAQISTRQSTPTIRWNDPSCADHRRT